MKITQFLAALSLALFSNAARADYTNLPWGLDRTTTPYGIGVNLSGVWNKIGSLTATGVASFGTLSASIFEFATCNGVAADDAGFTSASNTGRNIYVPSNARCKITDNLTLSSVATWTIEDGATINVAATKTLIFATGASIEAGRYQIFNGAGSVTGLAFPKPEWWGNSDQAASIQAAHDSAKYAALNRGLTTPLVAKYGVDLGCGIYTLGRTVNLSPSVLFPLDFQGCEPAFRGTRITVAESFTGTAAIDLLAPSNVGTDGVAQFNIGGFQLINNSTYAVTSGLRIGKDDGTTFNPTLANSVHDIAFENFPRPIDWRNGRLFRFERISSFSFAPNSTCVYINPTASSGSVAGDGDFVQFNCVPCRVNMSSCVGTENITLIANNAGTGITGLRFHSFIGYYSNRAIHGESTNGGAITDIWVEDGSQFDGTSEAGFVVNGAIAEFNALGSGSKVQNINIGNIYSRGSSDPYTTFAYRFYADDAAAAGVGINSVRLRGPWLANMTANAIWAHNVKGFDADVVVDSSGYTGKSLLVIDGATNDATIRLNAQTCAAPFVYDYGVIVADTADRVKVLPSVLSSCATTAAAVSSSGTQIDVSGAYPKNSANGPLVAGSDGVIVMPGGVDVPIGSALDSNLYYSGGWKYRANGFGDLIQFNGLLGGIDFYVTASNAGGAGAAATLIDGLHISNNGFLQFPVYGAGVLHTDSSGNVTTGAVASSEFADGNTGTGAVAHETSPTFTTPVLGSASATSVKLTGSTVAGLPTCDAGTEGTVAYVTDATAPTYNATLTGGGAVKIFAMCNGSNWTAH
jgi:hypothetical protein